MFYMYFNKINRNANNSQVKICMFKKHDIPNNDISMKIQSTDITCYMTENIYFRIDNI